VAIGEETARHFKIEADVHRQAWVYPIVINGQEVAKRYKSFDSKSNFKYWTQPSGKGTLVYNLDGIREQEEMWLCEGEPDVWILYQHGISAACFTGGAKHVPKDAAEQLVQAGVERINICYDVDAPGREGARRVAAALAFQFEVAIRSLPEHLGEGADITDLHRREKEHFKEALLSLPLAEFAPPKTVFQWDELVSGDLMPVDWLVEKLIPARGVVVVGGDAGVGKSWLALHIAQCAATGKPVLGQFTTFQGVVAYIDEESSEPLLKRRVQKLAAGLEVPNDIPVTFFVNHQVRIDREDNLEALLVRLEEQKPKLVIFDSLVRIHGANENDAQEMSEVMAKFREIQTRLGCALVFTHHSRKRSMINLAGEMLRGSTDIRAFVDTHLFMRAVRPRDQCKLIEHEKSRYCEPLEPFEIEIVDNEAGTATLLRYLGPCEAPKSRPEVAKELIIEILTVEGPMPRQEIIGRCKGQSGSRAVSDALKELYTEGVLQRDVGARGQHIYSLAQCLEAVPAEQLALQT